MARRYPDHRTKEIRQAQQDRLNELRPYMDQVLAELAMQTNLPLTMRDGYSGLRYVGKILYNQGDPEAIRQMPSPHLFALFRDGIVGSDTILSVLSPYVDRSTVERALIIIDQLLNNLVKRTDNIFRITLQINLLVTWCFIHVVYYFLAKLH